VENFHFFQNAIVAITTANIEKVDLLEELTEITKKLFEVDDLLVTYLGSNGDEKEDVLSKGSINSFMEAATQKTQFGLRGELIFYDLEKTIFSTRCEWNMFNNKSRFNNNEPTYKHNEITVQFNNDFVKSIPNKDRIIDFCKKLSTTFDVDYLKVYSIKNDRFGNMGKFDLSNGIHDIYWLNIYGMPFVKIIGRQKLLASPAYISEEIGSELILLQACEQFCDHGDHDSTAILNRIRAHIGEQFFYKSIQAKTEESGVFNVFNLFSTLWKAAKKHTDTAATADVCPSYDYTRMIY
jgi:hypothetical protein